MPVALCVYMHARACVCMHVCMHVCVHVCVRAPACFMERKIRNSCILSRYGILQFCIAIDY